MNITEQKNELLEVLVFAESAFSQYKEAHGTEKCEAYIRISEAVEKHSR